MTYFTRLKKILGYAPVIRYSGHSIMGKTIFRLNNKGYTLVEMMVVVFLIGIVTTVVSTLFVNGFRTYNEQSEAAGLQVKSRHELNRMKSDILEAKEIVAQYPETGAATYTTGINEIVIAIPSTVGVNNNWVEIPPNTGKFYYDYVIYKRFATIPSDNKLYKRVIPNPMLAADPDPNKKPKRKAEAERAIASNVTVLSFTYYKLNGPTWSELPPSDISNASRVKTNLTLQKTIRTKTINYANFITVNLRNKL